jgi:hypothetical protein
MDTQTQTLDRHTRLVHRTIRSQGLGSTQEGLVIAQRYIEVTKGILETKKLPELISFLNLDIISLVILQGTLSSIGNEDHLALTMHALAGLAMAERDAFILRKDHRDLAKKLETAAKRRSGSLASRRAGVRAALKRAGISLGKPWPRRAALEVGKFLVEVALETPVFILAGEPGAQWVTLTEEVLAFTEKAVDGLLRKNPVHLPLLCPPPPWSDARATIDGYSHTLVRSHHSKVELMIREAIKSGRMDGVLSAVNSAQAVSWSINKPILDLISLCYSVGVSVPGLPGKDDIPPPPTPDRLGRPER